MRRLKAGVKGALFLTSDDYSHIYADHSFMTKFLRSLLFIGWLGIILFFALKPDPEVPKGMAPDDVRVFFNTFDAFRNQLAFGVFGITALLLLMGRRILNVKQIVAIAAIALLIPILEFAQIWMPDTACRHRRCAERVARSRIGLPAVFGCSGFLENCESRRLKNWPCNAARGALKAQVKLWILILP